MNQKYYMDDFTVIVGFLFIKWPQIWLSIDTHIKIALSLIVGQACKWNRAAAGIEQEE